jgi:colanic acid biosynthesis glycosyl transferase WcaI
MVNTLGLKNVLFAPFVSKNEYPYLVKDMDVGLLSLTSKNQTPVVPGKILGYMAAGIPVLAFVQQQSDAHELIRVAKCGYSMVYGEPEKAAHLVECMYSQRDSLQRLGHNGAKYVAEFFSLAMAVDRIETLFQDSSANRHPSQQSLQVVGSGNV